MVYRNYLQVRAFGYIDNKDASQSMVAYRISFLEKRVKFLPEMTYVT